MNSSLNISGNTTIYGPLTVNNNTIIGNNSTLLSNLNVSGISQFNNDIRAITIKPMVDTFTNSADPNETLNIMGHIINIGSNDSIVNIKGTTTYVATSELQVVDKVITLNINPDHTTAIDNGALCGIEILGINGNGYIKTSNDSTRYIIKTPTELLWFQIKQY